MSGAIDRIVRDTTRLAVRIVKESTQSHQRRHPEGYAAGGRRIIPFNQETDR